jgi:hypothetical protein
LSLKDFITPPPDEAITRKKYPKIDLLPLIVDETPPDRPSQVSAIASGIDLGDG